MAVSKTAVAGSGMIRATRRPLSSRGAPVTVQIFENGKLRTEKPTQIPDEGGERELVFEFEHEKVGIFNYRVFVPPLAGEKNKDDNEYQLNVEAIDARNRLLYVAMTRARRKLLMIGDSATLSSEPFYARLIAYFESQGAYHTVWEEDGA